MFVIWPNSVLTILMNYICVCLFYILFHFTLLFDKHHYKILLYCIKPVYHKHNARDRCQQIYISFITI